MKERQQTIKASVDQNLMLYVIYLYLFDAYGVISDRINENELLEISFNNFMSCWFVFEPHINKRWNFQDLPLSHLHQNQGKLLFHFSSRYISMTYKVIFWWNQTFWVLWRFKSLGKAYDVLKYEVTYLTVLYDDLLGLS